METQTITPDTLAQLVAQLSSEQLRIVYEFVSFLRTRGGAGIEDELSREMGAWETASEIDAAWMLHLTASDTSEYAALRKQAMSDIEAGLATPMFNNIGDMVTE